MGAVNASSRCAYAIEERPFDGGGSRFAVGDTLMARITPCLENGKIARFCAEQGAVAHGSTEFIVIRGREGVSDTAYAYYLTKSEEVSGYGISQLGEDFPTLIGIDHGFSFPLRYFDACRQPDGDDREGVECADTPRQRESNSRSWKPSFPRNLSGGGPKLMLRSGAGRRCGKGTRSRRRRWAIWPTWLRRLARCDGFARGAVKPEATAPARGTPPWRAKRIQATIRIGDTAPARARFAVTRQSSHSGVVRRCGLSGK